jgi:hypothetical protein
MPANTLSALSVCERAKDLISVGVLAIYLFSGCNNFDANRCRIFAPMHHPAIAAVLIQGHSVAHLITLVPCRGFVVSSNPLAVMLE